MGRRRAGVLLPLELDLLAAAVALDHDGDCYGYALAKALSSGDQARRMVGHGTLYKALGRLTEAGLLECWWEEAATAEMQGRPRRRLYRITGAGRQACAGAAPDSAVTDRAPTSRSRGGRAAGATTQPGTAWG